MSSFYTYCALETLELQSQPSELDWWAWIPDHKINGQIKLEGGTKFGSGASVDPPRIRLIRLQNGNESDAIHIDMDIYGLLEAPEYDALSYVWGNPEKTRIIVCNGLPMKVNENVYMVLRRLRSTADTQTLWVDALCINQEDSEEKSNQVKLMGEIYSRARSVPIWLGQEADADAQAFQAVEAIWNRLSRPNLAGTKFEASVDKISQLDNFPKDGLKQISALLSRPWFSRLWVLQEAVKARKAVLLLGNMSIQFEWLGRVAQSLASDGTRDIFGAKLFSTILIQSCRNMERKGSNKLTIFDLIFSTNSLETSEPRDRLYALLNLPLVEMEWVPLPNYNLSRMEVFREFVILDLLQNKSFRAISWASVDMPDDRPDGHFPSWVPDFAKKHLPVIGFLSHGQKTQAGGDLKAEAKVHGKTILTMFGRKVGQIAQIGQSRREYYTNASVRQPQVPSEFQKSEQAVERQWIDECHTKFNRAFGSRFPNFQETMFSDLYKEFVRALCCNWDPIAQAPPNAAVINELRLVIWHLKAMEDDSPVDGEWDEHELYRIRLTHGATFRSRFCILEDGEMGWVPGGAMAGDVVFVFNGAVVPYLLRPNPDGTYLWIGESWVSGVMKGEILDSGVEPERIRIR